jgi:L-fuculose-phosphate aldolase
MHRDIYQTYPGTGSVVHTHSPFATTLACLRRPIPAFHYEVAFAGGNDIRCGDYATFGTQELSNHVLAALKGRRACLLANHGAVVFGATIEEAVVLAERVETLARLYWQALQVGEPRCWTRSKWRGGRKSSPPTAESESKHDPNGTRRGDLR